MQPCFCASSNRSPFLLGIGTGQAGQFGTGLGTLGGTLGTGGGLGLGQMKPTLGTGLGLGGGMGLGLAGGMCIS